MSLIDHTLTRVLLIGASEFPRDNEIRPIPNVVANLHLLKDCLINPEFVGIPEKNITLLLNENKLTIERHLHQLARETNTKDYTLIVYYSGHGMLSDTEYGLFLTTSDTKSDELEVDGIDITTFKKYFSKSHAGVKIAILDCCHSGGIFNTMGDMPSIIQANIKGFEGTYIITSAAEDKPALFPEHHPELPTYFTGKFIDVVTSGVEGPHEYCSLREIFNQIDTFCREQKDPPLPRPQQSNFQNADQLYFSRNKKFKPLRSPEEAAWDKAQNINDKWGYVDFQENFPNSKYAAAAIRKINVMEEEEEWAKATARNIVSAYLYYLDSYPKGQFAADAMDKIKALRQAAANRNNEPAKETEAPVKKPREEKTQQEVTPKEAASNAASVEPAKKQAPPKTDTEDDIAWKQAQLANTIYFYEQYLSAFPDGKYKYEARALINIIEKKVQKIAEEDYFWNERVKRDKIYSFEEYLTQYPTGKYVVEARKRIAVLQTNLEHGEGGIPAHWDEPKAANPFNKGVYMVVILAAVFFLVLIIIALNKDSGSNYRNTNATADSTVTKADSSKMTVDSAKMAVDTIKMDTTKKK